MYEFQKNLQNDIVEKFEKSITQKGFAAYKEIFDLIESVKDSFYRSYKDETEKEASNSWRVWKGNLYELLIYKLIEFLCKDSDFGVMDESELNSQQDIQSQIELNYQGGSCLPDIDVLIYDKERRKIVVVFSCKTSFRDRISMVAYWAIKIHQKSSDIKYVFLTADNDNALSKKSKIDRKARLILEDTDGAFVMNDDVEEGDKIQHFNKLLDYLESLGIYKSKNIKGSAKGKKSARQAKKHSA